MQARTEDFSLNRELMLHEGSESPLSVHTISLALTKENDTFSECVLTLQVSPELYQRIDSEALFNLKPEVRSPLCAGAFQPETDIQIEASLNPDLLPELSQNVVDVNQAAAYLQKLSQEQPNHPLLSTHSWYGLQVKQQRETGETGYRTLWLYISPSAIAQGSIKSEKISEGMANFIKDWAETSHLEMSQDNIAQTVEQMTHAFEELTDNISEMTQKAISEAVEQVTNAFEELSQDFSEITEEVTSEEPILSAMSNFFKKEDWHFAQIQGEPILQMAFSGKNGKWNCYAKTREEQQQIVFYSICPVKVPENKQLAGAEFVTRANYGTIIGNFELNFTDGEIRYKTSIDVEDASFIFPLLKRLVYANVMMMDEYLPGIISVIDGDVLPEDAIAQIEGQPE